MATKSPAVDGIIADEKCPNSTPGLRTGRAALKESAVFDGQRMCREDLHQGLRTMGYRK
jgi:hypothetical protein